MGDLPEVGPWAKEKLDALASYLDYYTKILKNKPWRTIYIDAFAGGGRANIRSNTIDPNKPDLWGAAEPDDDQREYIDGSPRVALSISNPFDRYVFIDADSERIAELNSIRGEFASTRTITIRPGLAEEGIKWVLDQKISLKTHRGVAFLDPFGAHLPWSSIESLAAPGLFEVMINFPLDMAINRLMKIDAEIPKNWCDQLDSVFGGELWFQEAYETNDGLFGKQTRKRSDARDRLLKFYCKNLKNAFGFVAKPKLITNTKGHPLYYLIWAGPHKKGLVGANYILGLQSRLQTGPRGGRPLSDA